MFATARHDIPSQANHITLPGDQTDFILNLIKFMEDPLLAYWGDKRELFKDFIDL